MLIYKTRTDFKMMLCIYMQRYARRHWHTSKQWNLGLTGMSTSYHGRMTCHRYSNNIDGCMNESVNDAEITTSSIHRSEWFYTSSFWPEYKYMHIHVHSLSLFICWHTHCLDHTHKCIHPYTYIACTRYYRKKNIDHNGRASTLCIIIWACA